MLGGSSAVTGDKVGYAWVCASVKHVFVLRVVLCLFISLVLCHEEGE